MATLITGRRKSRFSRRGFAVSVVIHAWAGATCLTTIETKAIRAQEVSIPPAAEPATIPPITDGAAGGLLDLSLEQLARQDVVAPALDIEVTSVSQQESTVGRSPAAVFVITPEMIRRSGATCIPEVLRMAHRHRGGQGRLQRLGD